jgi:Fe/S biogenesis protein NfuA
MNTDPQVLDTPDSSDADTDVEAPAVMPLRVTEAALEKILELKQAEDEPETLGLRVSITGTHGTDYTYDLAFEAFADAEDGDAVYQQGDLTVWVPADSIDSLDRATLDLPSASGQAGLVLRNPNKPDPLGGIHLDLNGTIAEKVQQLLAEQVNPALAAHGGYAELVGVDDTKVFITMGGGCQGCAVSAMTLRDGIERSIRENIPEVTDVIDATDHDAGETPYYS